MPPSDGGPERPHEREGVSRRADRDPSGETPVVPSAPARLPELEDFPETGPNALGSFGQRAVARILDEIIVTLPMQVVLFLLIFDRYGTIDPGVTEDFDVPFWYLGTAIVLSAVYEIVLVATWGRTVGKWLLGLRVARWTDGGRPTWSQSTLRCFLPLAAGAATLAVSDFSWGAVVILCTAFADSLRRGWHDKAGGTIVVRTR